MDGIEALLNLEDRISELRSSKHFDFSELKELGQMIAIAAKVYDGYRGLAWQYGGDLLNFARNAHLDEEALFDSFGWSSLKNGIESAIENREILEALCFAESDSFWGARSLNSNSTTIGQTLTTALHNTPRSFMNPSLLAAASEKIQKQFVSLFDILAMQPVDPELKLQWGACALRALPVTHDNRLSAAISFTNVLCAMNIPATAYCVFRALAEQHEELWISDSAIKVLRQYIELLITGPEQSLEGLVSLCVDDDLLRRCDDERNLLVILGGVGIYLVGECQVDAGELVAWRLVSGIQSEFPLLAHTLSEFLVNKTLPSWPEELAAQLKIERAELSKKIDVVKKLLRDRGYDGVPLAREIYQWNVHYVFSPFLEEIESCSSNQLAALCMKIESLDAKQLVLDNQNQRESRYPIEGRLLQKMISDNDKILKALYEACTVRKSLSFLRAELANRSAESFQVFIEFEEFTESIATESQGVLERLLPHFWRHLNKGLEISKKEVRSLDEA